VNKSGRLHLCYERDHSHSTRQWIAEIIETAMASGAGIWRRSKSRLAVIAKRSEAIMPRHNG